MVRLKKTSHLVARESFKAERDQSIDILRFLKTLWWDKRKMVEALDLRNEIGCQSRNIGVNRLHTNRLEEGSGSPEGKNACNILCPCLKEIGHTFGDEILRF